MANDDVPVPEGTDPEPVEKIPRPFPITAGGTVYGPSGIELKAGDRFIEKVIKDWDASKPKDTSDLVVVHGKTLQDVGKALLATNAEWGRGGGKLENDAVPAGTSEKVTVTLHGNLLRRMPNWAEYISGSTKGKANWDAMIAKLGAHEDKHVSNAVEAAEQLAKDLIGKEILQMPSMVTAANAALDKVQKKLDKDTDSGTKENVPFGGVILDTDES
jgi:hypothetical protein